MKQKYYYGFSHNYGKTTLVQGAPHGDGGELHIFSSKSDRDDWVNGDSNKREAYPSAKVRGHVKTGEYNEHLYSTRDLVDQALKYGYAVDKTV